MPAALLRCCSHRGCRRLPLTRSRSHCPGIAGADAHPHVYTERHRVRPVWPRPCQPETERVRISALWLVGNYQNAAINSKVTTRSLSVRMTRMLSMFTTIKLSIFTTIELSIFTTIQPPWSSVRACFFSPLDIFPRTHGALFCHTRRRSVRQSRSSRVCGSCRGLTPVTP